MQTLTIYNNGEADLDWNAYTTFSESSRVFDRSPVFGPGPPLNDRKITDERQSLQNPQNREEHYISEPSDHLSSIANVGASRSQRNGQGLDNI